jgi:tetratricopeptide (TPR) repeat protein
MGETEKARADFKQMESVFAPLAASHPEVPEYRRYLALCQYGLARSLKYSGQYTEGDKLYRAALDLQKQLVAEHPTVPVYSKELADTHQALAYVQPAGSARLARDWENEFRQALSLRQRLVKDHPDVTKYAIGLCLEQNAFGQALQNAGRFSEAEREVRQSLEELERFPKQTRNTVRLRRSKANAHVCLSFIYARQGQNKEAVKETQAALDLREALSREFPSVPQYRQGLAWEHTNLGFRYRQMRLWKQAEQEFLLARTLLEGLAADFPTETDYAGDAGWRDINLALLYINQGRPTEALESCKRAEPRFDAIRRQKPGDASDGVADANIRSLKARALAQQGHYAEALAEAERCSAKPSDANIAYQIAYQVACANSLLSAIALHDTKVASPDRTKISEAHASRAVELLAGIDWKKSWGLLEPLKTDKDLDPLRARSDFVALVKRAEKDSTSQPEKQTR